MHLEERILDLIDEYESEQEDEQQFIPGVTPIPVSGKIIGTLEKKNMIEAVLDGWLTTGRFNKAFEEKLSNFLGVHAITVNSGSSANLLALSALTSPMLGNRALEKGDKVITVAAGFPTTINPIVQLGMIPVFMDIEIPTYNIDTSWIETIIDGKTKAIMIAHTLGNPFNVNEILRIAKKYGLWIIEDCCDALGSIYAIKSSSSLEDHSLVGSIGDISTFSFYPAHHITTGEGGAVATNNPLLRQILRSLRDWGRACYCDPGQDNTCKRRYSDQQYGDLPIGYDHKYVYSHLGYNLKMTDMQAACGLAQMTSLYNFISKRRYHFKYLKLGLQGLEEFLILPEPTLASIPSWFGFPITLKGDERIHLLKYLEERKIGTRLLFGGNITKQPYFKDIKYSMPYKLTNTDIVMNKTFWVGCWPGLSLPMLDYIAESIKSFYQQKEMP